LDQTQAGSSGDNLAGALVEQPSLTGSEAITLQQQSGSLITIPASDIRKGKVELEMSRVAQAVFDEMDFDDSDEDSDDDYFAEEI
jgi:hypothetical protein